MKLKDLIRGKRADDSIATATHATVATNEGEEDRTVANVATVSVANPWRDETEELKEAGRHQRVLEMLSNNPTLKYAVLVDEATCDPVTITVGIRGLAVFNLEVPLKHYDGVALLQVIEQFSAEASPLPEVKEYSQAHPSEQQRKAA